MLKIKYGLILSYNRIIGSTFRNFDQRVVGAFRALRPLKLIYNVESNNFIILKLFRVQVYRLSFNLYSVP